MVNGGTLSADTTPLTGALQTTQRTRSTTGCMHRKSRLVRPLEKKDIVKANLNKSTGSAYFVAVWMVKKVNG